MIKRFASVAAICTLAAFCLTFAPEQAQQRPAVQLQPVMPFAFNPARECELPQLADLSSARVFHKVKRGDTLGSIFGRFGLSRADAVLVQNQVRNAVHHEKDLRSNLDPGQQIAIELSSDGSLNSVSAELKKDTLLAVRRVSDSEFRADLQVLEKTPAERVILGTISSSFSAAALASGASYETIDDFVDLFSSQVSFHKDFQPGDRFTIVYQDSVLSDGTSIGQGAILAAALEVNGKTYYAIRHVGSDGVARYFDKTGEMPGETFLRYPLKFTRISSYFTKSRFHPILRTHRPHNGVDFAAPEGTPVRAVADGKVEFAGRSGGSGIMVKLLHGERYSTAYLHLSRISADVRAGDTVRRGQVIGAVGSTGYATGPHLHFSFYDNGRYVNPLSVNLPTVQANGGQRVDQTYLRRVLFTLDHYQAVESQEFYALKPAAAKYS